VGINNRWFQLVASLIAMIMIANLQYAWTLFVEPMQTATGWQRSDIQAAFALFVLFQTWVQPCNGWLVDRLGPRWFITAAGLLCGLGWAGMGQATSLPMLYVTYCAAGIGAAFVYSCSIGSALKWFTQRRGLASGIMAAGFGGGTALFIPVISWLIETRGYETTFLATGLFQGLVIVIVAQFLRHPPRQPAPAQTAIAQAPTPQRAHAARPQVTTLEMLRTPQF
jgi:OFA family oxalate/formate antiporter-like MFS transporter